MDKRHKRIDVLINELGEWTPIHWEHPIPYQVDYITVDRRWVAAKEECMHGTLNHGGIQVGATHERYHLRQEVAYGAQANG